MMLELQLKSHFDVKTIIKMKIEDIKIKLMKVVIFSGFKCKNYKSLEFKY